MIDLVMAITIALTFASTEAITITIAFVNVNFYKCLLNIKKKF